MHDDPVLSELGTVQNCFGDFWVRAFESEERTLEAGGGAASWV